MGLFVFATKIPEKKLQKI